MRAAAFAFAFLALIVAQPAWADGPSDLINKIYAYYLDPSADGPPPGSGDDDEQILSKRLDGLFTAYEQSSSDDEVGGLDFDPFINAQDYDLKDLKIESDKVEGDKAIVVVSFFNFDAPTELTYSLVQEDGAWKVDDIESKDSQYPWVLSKILTDATAAQPPQQ